MMVNFSKLFYFFPKDLKLWFALIYPILFLHLMLSFFPLVFFSFFRCSDRDLRLCGWIVGLTHVSRTFPWCWLCHRDGTQCRFYFQSIKRHDRKALAFFCLRANPSFCSKDNHKLFQQNLESWNSSQSLFHPSYLLIKFIFFKINKNNYFKKSR